MPYTEKILSKYNTSVPRYTSYPTVPHWQPAPPSEEDWFNSVNRQLRNDRRVSLYLHLPFCEKLCTYCGCNKRITKNHAVEDPYIDSLINEWRKYISKMKVVPLIEEIHLGGGTPTFFSPKNIKYLISTITAMAEVAENASFSFEAHPSSTTIDHLTELREIGFDRISLGVQDISPKVLKAINRIQTVEQIDNITKAARSLGYKSVNYDIIYGLPFQDIEHVKDTMDFVGEQLPDRIAFYSYAHVPWKSKAQRGFTDDNIPKGFNKYELKKEGEKRMIAMGYKQIGMDHYGLADDSLSIAYEAGNLHRNFMGYTTSNGKLLIGLGASSISESPDMYIQNEKKIEDYNASIAKNVIPIIKGHHLSKADQVYKDVILELMCNEKTSLSSRPQVAEEINKHQAKIKDMESDGFLTYDGNQIMVTNRGREFVRNICAVIDPYMHQEVEELSFSNSI